MISRAVAIPAYLRQLGWVSFDPAWDNTFNMLSKGMLFIAGGSGTAIILWNVARAYRQRRRIHHTLMEVRGTP